MLTIHGDMGEGGGQVLRTSLSMSLCSGVPFRIINIRARRDKPGLRRQHLMAVEAAARICHGEVTGAALGSQELTFVPGKVTPGHYQFDIGTAGSTTLVLQTLLPALMLAEAPSSLKLTGGTHNPHAPPYEFLAHAFLPVINRMGGQISVSLIRPGFYPAGGGELAVRIHPVCELNAISLCERGRIIREYALAQVAHLPRHIAERELRVLQQGLGLPPQSLAIAAVEAYGPGNIVTLQIECEHITEVFCGYGERGVPAEQVAQGVVAEARQYLAAAVPIGRHLADQLLLPIALAGAGSMLTLPPSQHTLTNIQVIEKFLDVRFACRAQGELQWLMQLI